MASGDVDDLKELGHKLEIVFDGVEKLLVFGNLIHGKLSRDNAMEKVKNEPPVTRASVLRVQQQFPSRPQWH